MTEAPPAVVSLSAAVGAQRESGGALGLPISGLAQVFARPKKQSWNGQRAAAVPTVSGGFCGT